jgi:pilus assembly protein CpaF
VPAFLNLLIILIIILALVTFLYFFLRARRYPSNREQEEDPQRFTVPGLIEHVKDCINAITRTNLYELGLNEVEFKKQANKRAELKKALKSCMHGSIEDKQFVKAFIYDILLSYIPSERINSIIPFHNPYLLSTRDKFAIILHMLKKDHGFDALTHLIETYHLDELKPISENEQAFVITKEEIDAIYEKEGFILSKEERLEIITQLVYERYKGLGVIDEIRDMNIDGVSAGVSGITHDFMAKNIQGLQEKIRRMERNYESVWIFFKGKSIKLDFLGFENEQELRRVCQIIYRYNRGGQLSENTGYRVNEMKDGSRILVVRPPFSESWAFFVRKFHIKNVTLETLIQDPQAELPVNLIKYLAKGGMITAITGQQGSGKTTLLMAMIGHIYASLTLRIQEMAFELNLRSLYPHRNILTFKETENISGQQGLDIQKKTDGSVNILGEVATDPVAAWMIQMAQVASLFTLFTHHAKTTRDLIYSLRNSLLKCEMFNNEKIAEQQVVSVLDFDIHLTRDYRGKRYIERITEIVPAPELPYPTDYLDKDTLPERAASFMETSAEYYRRMTDRKTFETRNIIEFKDGSYVAVNPISEERVRKMKQAMTHTDAKAFEAYLEKFFGRQVV